MATWGRYVEFSVLVRWGCCRERQRGAAGRTVSRQRAAGSRRNKRLKYVGPDRYVHKHSTVLDMGPGYGGGFRPSQTSRI